MCAQSALPSLFAQRLRPRPWLWLAMWLLVGFGVACGRETATPTPEPLPPTAEPTPTTPAVLPTAEPTPTPRPTSTPTPTPTPLPPAIAASPQSVGDDGQLLVDEVTLPDKGWLAVYPASAEELTAEQLLAAVLLQPGRHPNLTLALDPQRTTSTLVLALYAAPDQADAELDPRTAEPLFQTSLAITLAMSRPSLAGADQEVLADSLVKLGPITSNGAGWVAIHNPDGLMLGYMPVPQGETAELRIPIRWRDALPDLTIALYHDAGQAGHFEPDQDLPVLFDGQPITHTLRVTLPLDIVAYDQPIVNRQLHVERVVSNGPGWVVVYVQGADGQPGMIVGSVAIQDGLNEHLVINLTPAELSDTLVLMLHDDTNPGNGFDFPANDPPRRSLGRAFSVPVNTAVSTYLIVRDQPLQAENTLVVPWVVVDAPAWVVVVTADENGESTGEPLGRTPIPAGVSRMVAITLTAPPPPTRRYWPCCTGMKGRCNCSSQRWIRLSCAAVGRWQCPSPCWSQMQNELEPITALILAAGESKRMGQAKLLLPWGAGTLLGQTIQQVRGAAVQDIWLVSGGYRAAVEAVAQAEGVRVVHNPAYATGEMLSSLQVGLRALLADGRPYTAALIMLGDLPFIPSSLINGVLDGFRAGRGVVVAPSYQGQRGHPVVLGRAVWEGVLALPPTAAPRDLFRQYPPVLLPVSTDLILRDIDTPEEYEALRSTMGQAAS